MTRDERLERIAAADARRAEAERAARDVWVRDTRHPLRLAHRRAILAFADELNRARRSRGKDHVSLRAAAEHLGVSPQMLSQRLQVAERMRAGERPWPKKRRAA